MEPSRSPSGSGTGSGIKSFFCCRDVAATGGPPMKQLLILAAAASLTATMANAQTTVTTTGHAGTAVTIEPESRTKIRTYITEHKIRPVETRERIVVGGRLPSDVELEAVPQDWGPS